MNEGGDKMVTNAASESVTRTKPRRSRAKKKQGPFLKVKSGSAAVPIYQTESKGRVRFPLSFYRDGRRERKVFNSLEDAKKEAQFVAHRIQVGMRHVTDLNVRTSMASTLRRWCGESPSPILSRKCCCTVNRTGRARSIWAR